MYVWEKLEYLKQTQIYSFVLKMLSLNYLGYRGRQRYVVFRINVVELRVEV